MLTIWNMLAISSSWTKNISNSKKKKSQREKSVNSRYHMNHSRKLKTAPQYPRVANHERNHWFQSIPINLGLFPIHFIIKCHSRGREENLPCVLSNRAKLIWVVDKKWYIHIYIYTQCTQQILDYRIHTIWRRDTRVWSHMLAQMYCWIPFGVRYFVATVCNEGYENKAAETQTEHRWTDK